MSLRSTSMEGNPLLDHVGAAIQRQPTPPMRPRSPFGPRPPIFRRVNSEASLVPTSTGSDDSPGLRRTSSSESPRNKSAATDLTGRRPPSRPDGLLAASSSANIRRRSLSVTSTENPNIPHGTSPRPPSRGFASSPNLIEGPPSRGALVRTLSQPSLLSSQPLPSIDLPPALIVEAPRDSSRVPPATPPSSAEPILAPTLTGEALGSAAVAATVAGSRSPTKSSPKITRFALPDSRPSSPSETTYRFNPDDPVYIVAALLKLDRKGAAQMYRRSEENLKLIQNWHVAMKGDSEKTVKLLDSLLPKK
eukprot:TRINITY_DN4681_c0_g1_i2.p1 TRINITY_DN4681_c0_g1~~TRINITY_DN4681_c0_g1_i2.p1  ORF type:complete len:306 (+),score=41.37 TRINITY_DN4681_c0_g1_i2:71-988(+)